jgi:hypothetical protein
MWAGTCAGSDRALGNRCDFLQRMSHVISELQGQTLLHGQLIQAVLQPILNLGVACGIDGLLGQVVQAARRGMVLLPAQGFESGAIGDPDDPSGNLRCVPEVLGALPDDHESIVDDLLDIFVARRDSRQKTREAPMVAKIQFLQRPSASRRDRRQKFSVVLLG